jgi:uncharacterized protein YggE
MAIALTLAARAGALLSVAVLVAAGWTPAATAAEDAAYVQIDTEASVRRAPDLAVVVLGITGDAADGQTALARHSDNVLRILAAMREAGIPAKDITQDRPYVAPHFESWVEDNRLHEGGRLGFRATTGMRLTLRDMARAGGVIQVVMQAGATYIDSITFELNEARHAAARAEARAAAIALAERFAMRSAREMGATAVRLVSAGEPPLPDGEADMYIPPEPRNAGPVLVIEPGEIDISEKVRARFIVIE